MRNYQVESWLCKVCLLPHGLDLELLFTFPESNSRCGTCVDISAHETLNFQPFANGDFFYFTCA
jgi:hypothetical protein